MLDEWLLCKSGILGYPQRRGYSLVEIK